MDLFHFSSSFVMHKRISDQGRSKCGETEHFVNIMSYTKMCLLTVLEMCGVAVHLPAATVKSLQYCNTITCCAHDPVPSQVSESFVMDFEGYRIIRVLRGVTTLQAEMQLHLCKQSDIRAACLGKTALVLKPL